jgi:hypothetical protein
VGVIVVALLQELVAPLLLALVFALIVLVVLFAAALGRALRNPGRPGERDEEGCRERESEERDHDRC